MKLENFVDLLQPAVMFQQIMLGFREMGGVFQVVIPSILIVLTFYIYYCAFAAVVDTPPYCEECKVWTQKCKTFCLPRMGSADEEKKFKKELESWNFRVLFRDRCPEATPDRWDVAVFQCSKCQNSDYLSISSIEGPTKDKNGSDVPATTTEIVKQLHVPHALIEASSPFQTKSGLSGSLGGPTGHSTPSPRLHRSRTDAPLFQRAVSP